MDTRRKILTAGDASRLNPARPLVLVTGYFDLLRAEHGRELNSVRSRTAPATLMVAVLPLSGEVLSQAARTTLVAAMHMVDYVVTAEDAEVDLLVSALTPSLVLRLEEGDLRRARQLIEHVNRLQNR
jgi:bifunctional ADP-heptose synthase (sugar kinase/adenylyltransferase)